MSSTGLDLQLTFSGMTREPPGARCEPCERCGTPLILDNLAAIAAGTRVADGYRGPPDPLEDLIARHHDRTAWIEHLTAQTPDGRWVLQLRPHTAERCNRARAGDPEPIDLGTDEDDDDVADVDGRWVLQLRPHTAERCARARAGDPEPLQLDDEDEDDGEDLDVVDLVPVDEAQDDG